MSVADSAVSFARAQIGKWYVWGATGPDTYDCSGLVYAAYQAAGHPISRTTYTQINDGFEVTENELKPGDLVFPEIGHVGIYSGNGHVIQSPESGRQVFEGTISDLGGFWRARRIVDDSGVGSGVGSRFYQMPAVLGGGGPISPGGPWANLWAYGQTFDPLGAIQKELDQIGNVFNGIGTFLDNLRKPQFWERAMLIVGGFIIAAIGAFMLIGEKVL